uniref:Uncharacterized protein n=1 Tax=Arundo donax TaxID=35708 RepID=A0A0A9D6H2_ARUDO
MASSPPPPPPSVPTKYGSCAGVERGRAAGQRRRGRALAREQRRGRGQHNLVVISTWGLRLQQMTWTAMARRPTAVQGLLAPSLSRRTPMRSRAATELGHCLSPRLHLRRPSSPATAPRRRPSPRREPLLLLR